MTPPPPWPSHINPDEQMPQRLGSLSQPSKVPQFCAIGHDDGVQPMVVVVVEAVMVVVVLVLVVVGVTQVPPRHMSPL
jgi:hypothetical protein